MVPQRISLVLFFLLAASHVPEVLGEVGEREDRRFLFNAFNRRPSLVDREDRSCSCTCGERNDATRIVGGKPTLPNEFPWIVRLSYFNRFYCGGMLINDRYVLTAAHCVKGFMWFMIKVTFGEHDRCDKSFRPETRFVLRAITGDFSYLNFENDIAILRLNDRVPMTQTIRPICLPKKTTDLYEGRRAIVSGWGTLKEDGKPACILQEVEVPVMSNAECKNTSYSEKIISDNMLCAGYPEGMKDSCQGDSGGPLIREKEDKRYELIGVVSWGNGCARPGFPGIYTRVTRYLDWIKSNTGGGCWCEDPSEDKGEVEESTTVVTEAPETTARPMEELLDKDKPTQASPIAEPEQPMNSTSQIDQPMSPANQTDQPMSSTIPTDQKPVEIDKDQEQTVQTSLANQTDQTPMEQALNNEQPPQTSSLNETDQKPMEQALNNEKPPQNGSLSVTDQKAMGIESINHFN